MDQRPARSLRFAGSLTMVAVVGSLLVMGAPASQAVNVAQSAIVNPNPANWTPNVLNGQVNSFVQIGTKVYAGGRSRRSRPRAAARSIRVPTSSRSTPRPARSTPIRSDLRRRREGPCGLSRWQPARRRVLQLRERGHDCPQARQARTPRPGNGSPRSMWATRTARYGTSRSRATWSSPVADSPHQGCRA